MRAGGKEARDRGTQGREFPARQVGCWSHQVSGIDAVKIKRGRRSHRSVAIEQTCLIASGDLPSDVDRLEPLLSPVDYENAKPLLHPRFDVGRVGGITARHVELLARREYLLDRRFPTRGVEHPLAARVGRAED